MPASHEFSSFRAISESRHRSSDIRPTSAGGRGAATKSAEPWLPNGPNKNHQRSRGLPSKLEREAAANATARSEAAAEVHGVGVRLEGAETAMSRLERTLDRVVASYEQHVVHATASSVLLAKRLGELGFGHAA